MASTVCGGSSKRRAAPCLSNLTYFGKLHLFGPVRCLLESLMDSVRLSGLVSCLPSRGLDDGPVVIV